MGVCLQQQFSLGGAGGAAPRRHSGSVWRLRAGGGSAPRGQGCRSAPRSAQDRASAVPRPGSPCQCPPVLSHPSTRMDAVSAMWSVKSLLFGKEMGTEFPNTRVSCGTWGWAGATHKLGRVRRTPNHAPLAPETWPQTEGDPRAANQPDASGRRSATQNVN